MRKAVGGNCSYLKSFRFYSASSSWCY
uniref:Uncharacterized protein n=1 Tax=Anguilla anguilla TaxID=7936 RepID=A0A0E9UDD8_ANGAN